MQFDNMQPMPVKPKTSSNMVVPIVAGIGILGVVGVAGYFGYQAYNKTKSGQQMQSAQAGCTTCGQQASVETQTTQQSASQKTIQSQVAQQQSQIGKQSQTAQQQSQQQQAQQTLQVPVAQTIQTVKGPQRTDPVVEMDREYEGSYKDGPFKIVSGVNRNLAVDVAGESKDPFAHLVLWPFHGRDNQRFTMDDSTDLIKNVGSSMVLSAGIGPGKPVQGAQIIQSPISEPSRQRWEYDSKKKEVQLVGTGLCLDAKGTVAEGTKMVAWPCHGGENQRFDFVSVSEQV